MDEVYDRLPVYEEAGDDGPVIVYRASSFGYCMGALVRARLGMTPSSPPDVMLERYQEGHDWERRVLAAGLGVDWTEVTATNDLARFGHIVEGQNGERQVETKIAWRDKIVRCHPDAFVRKQVDRARGELAPLHVCEVKFLGPDYYNRVIADVEKQGMLGLGLGYAWQASIEMLSTGLPLLYIIGQKQKMGEGKVGLLGAPVVYEFDTPCFTLTDIKMRVAEIEGWVARGEMPPCPVPFDYPCGFWYEHEKREAEEITDEQMVLLVESYGRAKAAEARHKAEADRIKADIDARMVEVGVDGGLCNGWQIARTQARKGNVSWSKAWKALPKDVRDGVDVEQYRGAEVAAGVRLTKAGDEKMWGMEP